MVTGVDEMRAEFGIPKRNRFSNHQVTYRDHGWAVGSVVPFGDLIAVAEQFGDQGRRYFGDKVLQRSVPAS